MDSLFSGTAFAEPKLSPLPALPPGFTYGRDFLTQREEQELLAEIQQLDLRPSQYHEYTARRRTASFGIGVRFGGTTAQPLHEVVQRPPAPYFIQALAAKVARRVGLHLSDFPHALVTEYPPGAPIGWHRDAPPFAAIYGVSLASACTFRLRPMPSGNGRQRTADSRQPGESRQYSGADPDSSLPAASRLLPAMDRAEPPSRDRKRISRADGGTIKLHCEPRSLYAMRGPSRSVWQHSIPPVKETRYSITLRTLR